MSARGQERLFDCPPPASVAGRSEQEPAPVSIAAVPALPAGQLTCEQEQAIARRSEPLLLAAGAGSGKTAVLVERFVHAVLEDGLAPGAVLAITFTERAAGELRERVRARLAELGARTAARDTEAAFIGTFHGFCARILRAHPLSGALPPDFTILDEGLARGLSARAFAAALMELQQRAGGEAVDLLAAYGVDAVRDLLIDVYGELRSRGQADPRLPPVAARFPGAENAAAVRACELLGALLEMHGRRYTELKRSRGVADFDDLELGALALLRSDERARRSWAERFQMLMVDEFQDTNPRQLEILSALERDNLFTVGDELQAIYGFRHARVELFRARRRRLAAQGRSLALTESFRGAPALLAVVNELFDDRMGEHYTRLRAGREDSPGAEPAVELLVSDRCGWDEAGLAARVGAGMPSASPWRQAEAHLLAQRIAQIVDGVSVRAGDVVVLLRASGDAEVYERALRRRGLRTLAHVGGFWDRLEVRDMLARLRALANPLDETALYEALAAPPAGLDGDALATLAGEARAQGGSVWEVARTGGGSAAEACERLAAERALASRVGPAGILERVLSGGYREQLGSRPEAERTLVNVNKLLRIARRFQASEGMGMRAFLDHCVLLSRAGPPEPDAPLGGAAPDAVRLMTIHAAKGLEFPVVCVADLGRSPNTRLPRLLVDGERIGLSLLRLDGRKATPELEYEKLAEERAGAEREEEDRILYVAMTRARERLLLSGALDFERWGDEGERTPIGWVAPLLARKLAVRAGEGDGGVWTLPVGDAPEPPLVRCVLSRPGSVGRVLCLEDASGPQERVASAQLAERAAGSATAPSGGGRSRRSDAVSPGREDAWGGVRSLSYTALSSLERCGYRFYLERVLGMPEDRAAARGGGGELAADVRGTLVHGLLERVDFARPRVPSREDVAARARARGAAPTESECERIVALVAGGLAGPGAARLAAATEVRHEHAFAFAPAPDEPLISGVIDVLAREQDGGALVVDYKTDRLEAGADIAALADRDYGLQRLIYAVAVLREGAAAVEVAHWFLERPAEWTSVTHTRGELGALEELLRGRIARARARGFAVSERPHRALCLTCPGRAGLCSWSEREQLRQLFPEGAHEQ
jgi:ATP-dependent exoDNAse (exonuclease V) beta subunit